MIVEEISVPEKMQESIIRLSKDLKLAAKTMNKDEARFLVDAYYQMQDNRIRADGQVRSMSKEGEPCSILAWLSEQSTFMENQVKRALDSYSDAHEAGRWAKFQYGIGPVISAGLLAHIDVTDKPHVGHIWNYAGLGANQVWGKGEKRPWNAELKTLCWKIGQSFMKFSNREDCFYGKLYKQRKALEVASNLAGKNAESAAKALVGKNWKATKAKETYESGVLPDGHVDARARRWVVKMFLSHYHHVAYKAQYGVEPSKPYVIAILGHADYIAPPPGPE